MQCSSELMAAPGRECHKLSERLRERKMERTQERRRLGKVDIKRLRRGWLLKEGNQVNNKM